jgi:ABC-type microcin C transport system duplicated ATPase subunit YejF
LSTVRDANRIVVVDKGEVVEDGSHAELLALPEGRYARLWHAQTGPVVPPPLAAAVTPTVSRGPDGQMIVRRPVPLRMAEPVEA